MRGGGAIALAVLLLAAPAQAKPVPEAVTRAIQGYGHAAEKGDGEAFYKLGAINWRGGAKAKAYACFLLAAQLGRGDTPKRAKAVLAKLGPHLSTQARHDAEELAAAWRMTIDR